MLLCSTTRSDDTHQNANELVELTLHRAHGTRYRSRHLKVLLPGKETLGTFLKLGAGPRNTSSHILTKPAIDADLFAEWAAGSFA